MAKYKKRNSKPEITILTNPEPTLIYDYIHFKYDNKKIYQQDLVDSNFEHKIQRYEIKNKDILLLRVPMYNKRTNIIKRLFNGETKYKWSKIIIEEIVPMEEWKSDFNVLINLVDNYITCSTFNKCQIFKGNFDKDLFYKSFLNSCYRDNMLKYLKDDKIYFYNNNNELLDTKQIFYENNIQDIELNDDDLPIDEINFIYKFNFT
jgi:hypothetical protein